MSIAIKPRVDLVGGNAHADLTEARLAAARSLAATLREEMARQGWSQQRLGTELGYTQNMICQAMAPDKYGARLRVLTKALRFLGYEVYLEVEWRLDIFCEKLP